MRVWAALLLWLFAPPAWAEDPGFPALYTVTGVAAGDVLNLRSGPGTSFPVQDALPPGAKGVEVLGLSADGAWAETAGPEGPLWAATRFLARESGAGWAAPETPLSCSGTEPFWAFTLSPSAARFEPADGPALSLTPLPFEGAEAPGTRSAALRSPEGPALALIRAEACSDGMSDRPFGLSLTLVLFGQGGAEAHRYQGCCTLAPTM